jgi:hypothetical protein
MQHPQGWVPFCEYFRQIQPTITAPTYTNEEGSFGKTRGGAEFWLLLGCLQAFAEQVSCLFCNLSFIDRNGVCSPCSRDIVSSFAVVL